MGVPMVPAFHSAGCAMGHQIALKKKMKGFVLVLVLVLILFLFLALALALALVLILNYQVVETVPQVSFRAATEDASKGNITVMVMTIVETSVMNCTAQTFAVTMGTYG
jgi:flagellar basal body-associated protein FliL